MLAYVRSSILPAVFSVIWTVFYFFYFLFKGKEEWKCGELKHEEKRRICCVDGKPTGEESCTKGQAHAAQNHHHSAQMQGQSSYNASLRGWAGNGDSSSSYAGQSRHNQMIGYAKSAANKVRNATFKAAQLVGTGLVTFWRWLTSPLPSKALPPSAPRPYQSTHNSPSASPSYNKVVFEPTEIDYEYVNDETADESVEEKTVTVEDERRKETERENERKLEEHRKKMEEKRKETQRKEREAAAEKRKKLEEEEERRARERAETEEDDPPTICEQRREKSIPPPAPPPPPPKTTRITPAREVTTATTHAMDTDNKAKATETHREKSQPKVGALPKDVMQELADIQKRRERGISAQREMTQSCHPDMPSWNATSKQDDLYSHRTATGNRANSVGPSMRKLEQHVSRLEGNSDDEAHYVFRPKKPRDDNFYLGRCVFSPVEEAEQMRARLNAQRPQSVAPAGHYEHYVQPSAATVSYGSSQAGHAGRRNEIAEEMERRRARTVGPYGRNTVPVGGTVSSYAATGPSSHAHNYSTQYNSSSAAPSNYTPINRQQTQSAVPWRAPFKPSSAYSSAPFSAHAFRSKTPVTIFNSGVTRVEAPTTTFRRGSTPVGVPGAVINKASAWPPLSNASGAEMAKDDWLRAMGNQNDDDELITTMCRRVVERKTENNWKWKDEHGRLLDEQKDMTWKGELDTVLRDGPNEGRHWSRQVERLPTGDTRFQDISRQYNNNFVVESIVRNY